jgi:hypothetical protein
MARICIVLLVGVLICGSSATGQEAPRGGNPHGQIDLDCTLCHSEGSWQPTDTMSRFDHASTGYPLEGRHGSAHCRDCHQDPRFAFVGTGCADCHADFHAGRLGPNCDQCHTTGGWIDRSEQRIAHDATSFPLVGAHERVDCEACHADPLTTTFTGTPTDCVYCHAEIWAATTAPDHESVGFGHDCLACHSIYSSTWGGGDFVHPPSFPLTGGHGALDCSACHIGGFGTVPADCYFCHQEDYEATTDPNHLTVGFPVDCAACHTTTRWEPSNWDHDDLFPIYSGRHREEWNDCADCHVTATDYSVYECIFCHEHDNQSETDRDHSEVRNYEYLSTACLECHPDGSK